MGVTLKLGNKTKQNKLMEMKLILSSLLFSQALCAPGKDAVRLDAFFRLEQRIPNTCSTRSGQACVFPFKYKGVEYLKCTFADSPTPWCATQTDSSENVVTNKWGDCDDSATTSCTVENFNVASCSTSQVGLLELQFQNKKFDRFIDKTRPNSLIDTIRTGRFSRQAIPNRR